MPAQIVGQLIMAHHHSAPTAEGQNRLSGEKDAVPPEGNGRDAPKVGVHRNT